MPVDTFGINKKLIENAKEAAKRAEVVLVFVGLDEISETEGMDRKHMRMPNFRYYPTPAFPGAIRQLQSVCPA